MGDEIKERHEASACVKFRLLMWKNFLLQRRHPIQTVAELLVPVLAMSLILILRSQVEPYQEGEVRYPPIRVDTLYSSNSSLLVLRGMNLSELSVAYSPESPLLESVVRDSVTNMLLKNMDSLIPIILENFPNIAESLPLVNVTLIEGLVRSLVRVSGYNNSESMRGIYYVEQMTRNILVGVEFPDEYYGLTELPSDISYALRFPEQPRMSSFYSQGARSWRTVTLFPPFAVAGPRDPDSPDGGNNPGYMNELFIAIQHSISMELISRLTGEDLREFSLHVQRYPHPPYINDLATSALIVLFPMFLVFSFSYTAINMVRAVTMEKELQLKETMKIMGLSTWLHWTAWFCKQFLYLLVVAVLLMLLLKVNWFTSTEGFSDYAVFTHTPWTVLLFFLLLYLSCTIFLSFMLSGFFSTASTAALFSGIIWFLMYAPAAVLAVDENVSMSLQIFTCLSLNSAMAYGFQLLLSEESTGGMQWSQFFASASDDSARLLFGHVVLMILFDCVIYMLIALYLEQVLPGAFGTPKKWYFMFQKEFWCPNNSVVDFDLSNVETATVEDPTLEEDPKDLAIGVKISKLTKVYGNNLAVNNLSLNIYNDQITVLLGHNGAGKSTTISVLTGNTVASAGSVWVAGYDIHRQAKAARTNLGFCPQHNVLFPELTVREHLEFFARLKGLKGDVLTNEIENLILKLELHEKSNYQAGGLSGGQKRRLSVGIALCGGAKVVLLDEPTSGMDPSSRRGLWTLLQKEKHGRSMILTTHFMDEADYLGDRVAIMATGRLQCVGTPYFLKKHYGVGYTLIVVKGANFNEEKCTAIINKYIPDINVKEDRGTEVTYALSTEHSHTFEPMLTDLENSKQTVDFNNYGLSATTMEDVFMSAGSDVETAHDDSDDATTTTTDSVTDEPVKNSDTLSFEDLDAKEGLVTGCALIWQHCYAIWFKLYLVWTRSWGVLALQILVPTLILSISLGIFNYITSLTDLVQSRALTLERGFRQTETYVNYNGTSTDSLGWSLFQTYLQLFNNNNRRAEVINNMTIEDYYLQQGSDNVELGNMRAQVIAGATFSDNAATAWFSNFGYHDVAISVATMHSALLKSKLPQASLSVANHPIEANYENSNDMQLIVTVLSMNLANAIGNCLTILSAVFVMFYIKERVSRAKLLQKASGIEPVVMWGSAIVFDWLWFLLVSIIFLVLCAAFSVQSMSTPLELGRLYVVFMVYGVAMLPMMYVMSYFFTVPAFGFVVSMFINILFGLMGAQIVEALLNLDTDPAPQIMDGILQFFPLYSAAFSIRRLHEISLTQWSCLQLCDVISAVLPTVQECTVELVCQSYNEACCVRKNPYFEWQEPGILRYLMCMLFSGTVMWLGLMFAEYRLHKKISLYRTTPPEIDTSGMDEDVLNESKHVEFIGDSALKHHNLVARKLTKYYKKNLAVNQVSFSVGEMECFGLLGVNGAGKTSTFKMLMGDETISSGDAFVRGHSVRKSIKKVHANIGYCPQFDAVFDELTGRETLRLFALLRGLKPATTAALTNKLAANLGFTKHLDKKVCQYSGGNKRKLSTAIALLGYARVVFLDEPTTGVDPAAKRQVWRAIRKATNAGRAVVLTSHSMEECEALCSRLTIMVNGQFKCLGTPQHLKNKYSEGFTLTIKMKTDDQVTTSITNQVKNYVFTHFSNPKLMEEYQGMLTYYLPDRSMPWSKMFGVMETAKEQYPVDDYNISQTTLEQIFLQFTKYQREADSAQEDPGPPGVDKTPSVTFL